MFPRQRTYQIWPPLAWAGTAFVAGALLTVHIPQTLLWLALAFLICGWALLNFYIGSFRFKEACQYGIALLAFLSLGTAYTCIGLGHDAGPKNPSATAGHTVAKVVLTSDTATAYGSLRAEVKVLGTATEAGIVNSKIRLRLRSGANLAWGDTAVMSLRYWPSTQRLVPWAQFAAPSPYQYQATVLEVHQIKKQDTWHPRAMMLYCRQWLENNLRTAWHAYTNGQQSHALTQVQALLHGLSLGLRQGIAPEVNDQFSYSGTAHILSVSGMHMMVLFALLQGLVVLLNPARKLKRMFWYAVILLLWSYALLTGMSAAAIRAAAMASVLVLAAAHQKSHAMLNALGLAALVMVALEPEVVYSISFQLSFLGCVGIALWGQWPWAHRRLYTNNWPRWVAALLQTAMVSVGAMLATLPITAYHFGQVPMLFLPANLLAGITSSALTIVSLAMAMVGQIPVLNWILAAMAHVLGSLTLLVVELMGKVDQTVQLPFLNKESLVLYLCIVVLLWQAVKMQQNWALLFSCAGLVVMPLSLALYPQFWSQPKPQGLYAWKTGRARHAAILTADTTYWLTDPPVFTPKTYTRWLGGRPQKRIAGSEASQSPWLSAVPINGRSSIWVVRRKPNHTELNQFMPQRAKHKASIVLALDQGAYQANICLESPIWVVTYAKPYLPQSVQVPLAQRWYHTAFPTVSNVQ